MYFQSAMCITHFIYTWIYFQIVNGCLVQLILWQKVRQTRIFAIVQVFPYYEEAKKRKKMNFFDLRGVFIAGGILLCDLCELQCLIDV